MKHIIFTLVFTFGLFAQAENWMRFKDIKRGSFEGYELKETCEQNKKFECVLVDGIEVDEKIVVDTAIDNLEKPILDEKGEVVGYEKHQQLIDDVTKITEKQAKKLAKDDQLNKRKNRNKKIKDFLQNANPTQAETRDALKFLIREYLNEDE